MKTIAVIGANGFVGSAICRSLIGLDFLVTRVTRENYNVHQHDTYDILVNAAMPSRRFWALSNPKEDVNETITKTARLFYEWRYKKFVQISSVSASTELSTPYGAHKRAAEIIALSNKDSLVIRLGALYGRGLTKGALFDVLNRNHLYVDIASAYNYIDVDVAAKYIISNVNTSGILNVGARDTISLLEISKFAQTNPTYEGRLERISFDVCNESLPGAKDVLSFVATQKKRIST